MKKFDIPAYFKSPIIGKVKAKRKLEDPLKKDFSPSILSVGNIDFIIGRHFGFCYGVENAIEKSYLALKENPDKKIYLLSQMIHNPDVNRDLNDLGVDFIQDTSGKQLLPWSTITKDDVVIIPAFGTTLETQEILESKGIDILTYNTTCPFVEKVWNRSASLGNSDHTIIIHGKFNHEETKATFSHSNKNSPSVVIKDLSEARILASYINDEIDAENLMKRLGDKCSDGFEPKKHLDKIGVVNQTTMLASETLEISEFFKRTMEEKYGSANLKDHFADTRDTLCYATNDNQSATLKLAQEKADLAFVIGGYNSSNTSHLVEILESKLPTYFIKNEDEIISKGELNAYDIHTDKVTKHSDFLPSSERLKIIITSGASCPDSIVDGVIKRLLDVTDNSFNLDEIKI